MFAGLNVFFTMVMVLSDTEAVLGRVITVAGRIVVDTGEGVAVALVTVPVGCTGGDSEHPQVSRSRKTMTRSTETILIDAGRSFPYNKMMAHQLAQDFCTALRCRQVLLPGRKTSDR
jgi:hypothetical protein